MCALALAVPAFGRDKKHNNRAMIEKMEAVPCGAKERGITGLGSVFASIGATHVDSTEKLCPQYLLRTDDMEYHVRPMDHKHPVILPVGQEGEFKISKDVMEVRIPDGDHKKRKYQVVAMKPVDHSESSESAGANAKYDRGKDYTDKPLHDRSTTEKATVKNPGEPPAPQQ
jgi:hypothetical protein